MKLLNQLDKAVKADVNEALSKLGEIRDNIPPDKLITYLKLYITLKSLNAPIDRFFPELLGSIGISYKSMETSIEPLYKYTSTMHILRKIHGKRKFTVSEIFSNKTSQTDLLDYIWLRKNKYIIKTRSKRLTINRDIYGEFLDKECERSIDYKDIYKYMIEIPSRLWPKLITPQFLKSLDSNRLVQLIEKYYGYNEKVDKTLLNEAAGRVKTDNRLSTVLSSNERIMKKLTKRLGYVNPYSINYMNEDELREVNIEDVLRDLYRIPIDERRKIISRNMSKRSIRSIMSKLDIYTLSGLNVKIKEPRLKAKILLGKAVGETINYLITNDPARLDYAEYLLSKIDPEQLDPDLKPIYESMISRDYTSLLYSFSRRKPEFFIEYLALTISKLVRERGVIEKEMIDRAIKIGYIVLRNAMKRIGEPVGRYKYSPIKGFIDLRKTIYNYVRLNYEITRRDRWRMNRIHLLIDTSGSMLKFSTWAILSSAYFLPVSKYIVLFSREAIVFKSSKKTIRELLIRFLVEVYLKGFTGYTNITNALRTVYRLVAPGDRVVMFSDLMQTIPDEDPAIQARRILDKQVEVTIITPQRHDPVLADKLVEMGCRLYIEPKLTPRLIKHLIG